MTPLDRAWLGDHPLPGHDGEVDKNSRGRVLIVGGSRFVPGAPRLTAEAALRAGCGKVQLATVADASIPLGIAVPEAAVIALPSDDDGEIAESAATLLRDAIEACDCLVIGPGMSRCAILSPILRNLSNSNRQDLTLLLDAAAIPACADLADCVKAIGTRVVLTPHIGEMAGLTDRDPKKIERDPQSAAEAAAERWGASIALKGPTTLVASPGLPTLRYAGGGVGLATGGSGDVLAGIAAGLLSRGTAPDEALAWAVWVHGEAGRLAADRYGKVGFLARELHAFIPALLCGVPDAGAETRP